MLKLLVISMCSKEKAIKCSDPLTIDDFSRGKDHIACREQNMKCLMMPAAEFYLCVQHRRLMNGIRNIYEAKSPDIVLDHWILSAGYGFIRADRMVVPYDCTFKGMKKRELKDWAERIHVFSDVKSILEAPYDFSLVLLTSEYMEACCFEKGIRYGGKVLFLCSKKYARKLPATDTVRTLALTNTEASKFKCGLVSLKGELASRILLHILENPDIVSEFPDGGEWTKFFETSYF